jgi:hypothetical protein
VARISSASWSTVDWSVTSSARGRTVSLSRARLAEQRCVAALHQPARDGEANAAIGAGHHCETLV